MIDYNLIVLISLKTRSVKWKGAQSTSMERILPSLLAWKTVDFGLGAGGMTHYSLCMPCELFPLISPLSIALCFLSFSLSSCVLKIQPKRFVRHLPIMCIAGYQILETQDRTDCMWLLPSSERTDIVAAGKIISSLQVNVL